jgi:hypothetical protein
MNRSEPLDLRDVTLCAVDTINPKMAARALDISMSQCTFGDAILLAHEPTPTRARVVTIDPVRSLEAYSTFMVKQLASYIATPWVLVVQWDGYVVDASRWTDTFLQYDYIGAPWPHHRDGMDVGNGGFSLRSARLLQALASERFPVPSGAVEDELICRFYRSALEAEYGIRFAPAEVAERFSYEGRLPSNPTFGFHGSFNLCRHVDDSAMTDIIRELDIRTLASKECLTSLKVYCDLGRVACRKALYERYRSHWSAQEIVDAFVRIGMPDEYARHYADMCEGA